jgi:hypothetical protein
VRRVLSVLVLFILTASAEAQPAHARNPYPNELPGFRFYARYMIPLRPYISDRNSVIRAFGSTNGLELHRWYVWPHFVAEGNVINGHAWARDITGRLATVEIIPRQRVSMAGMKFPRWFKHGVGHVSEINVACDIYGDAFGLQYWLYAADSASGAKGDLMKIVYGPSKRVERRIIGSP